MKKNLLLAALAVGSLLGATSCSSDEPNVPVNDGQSITVRLPKELNRAFGDGQSALKLEYAIYPAGQTTAAALKTGEATFVNLQTTVNVALPKGKKYDIIFFAKNASAPYEFAPAGRTLTVDYTAFSQGYSEVYDVFCWTEKDFSLSENANKVITLRRPLAQLNIGATDYDDATAMGLLAGYNTVTVSGVYNTMDLYTGECIGTPTIAEYPQAAVPAATEVFPIANVKYMSMVYALVDAAKSNHDVTFKTNDPDFSLVTFNNVPMQRNYKTNIYGTILSSIVTFTIDINPGFVGDHNEAYEL